MKNKDKIKKTEKGKSLLYDLRLFCRGIKIAYRIDRRFLYMQIAKAAADVVRSYVTSFLAAIIIDGITSGKPIKTLIIYALAVVAVELVLDMINQIIGARRYIRKSMWDKYITRFFVNYSEKTEYWRFEDSETKEKWERIKHQIADNDGIAGSHFTIYTVTRAVFGIATSVGILSVMLLSKPQTPQTGIMAFVNSPFIIFAFVAMLCFILLLTGKTNSGWAELYEIRNNYWGKGKKRFYSMTDFADDNKMAMDTRIYGFKNIILKENEAAHGKYLDTINRTKRKQFLLEIVSHVLYRVPAAMSYVIVGLKALSGAFGLGSVVLYVGTLIHFTDEARNITSVIGEIKKYRCAFEDQFSFIDMAGNTNTGTRHIEKMPDGGYSIEFKDVSFKYPACDNYALRHISVKIKAGMRLALVGMNGSGKTTFIKLLCRLYDATEGEILLNGINVKEYDYDEYIELLSVVFQDFKLFAFKLSENIAVSREYDSDRIAAVLSDAGFGERLASLPDGAETYLYKAFEKNGIEISGGEAQKLALARALYKNAPFIILDEPTAALDPLAEAEVYANFNKIVGGKTAVYISHRLSSCKFCDEIAVFDKGELVQYGSHDALVSADGKYREMWNAQAQYFAENKG